jgi:hypothetical protein
LITATGGSAEALFAPNRPPRRAQTKHPIRKQEHLLGEPPDGMRFLAINSLKMPQRKFLSYKGEF